MKTGISTACFYPMLFEEAMETALRLGFKRLEVFVNTEQEFQQDFIRRTRGRIDEAGARVVSVHAYSAAYEDFLFFSTYERRTEDNLRMYSRFFEAARLLGAKYFTFHGKRRWGLMPGAPAPPNEKELICRNLNRLCREAKENGISLSQENVVLFQSAELSYIGMLKEQVPELLFTLDIKQARRAELSPFAYIDAMGDRLVNIHLNDFNGEHTCMLPFAGIMDYEKMLDRLGQAGYRGDFILEVYGRDFSHPSELVTAAESFDRLLAEKGFEMPAE